MQLSRKGDYALRAMLDLASQPSGKITLSREIAARQAIPPKFLPQIMLDLGRAGLVQAIRGAGGGFKMVRSPDKINIKEIIEAIEGPVALNLCLVRQGGCERKKICSIYDVWAQAQKEMLSVLEKTTLKDLVNAGKRQK